MQFKEVVGQQELKDHLIREVNSDKVSHAQLFLGQNGYGGLPLALAFVQYLFCEQKSDTDSCGACPSCQKVEGLQHPDLHFSFPVVQTLGKRSDLFLTQWREQIKEQPYFTLSDWTARIDERERRPLISVEESQDIIRKLSLKSFEGGYKVMIIWMAEEMNLQCANKLLKILEEPPLSTVFILLCESQDQLLPTIVSRTQILKIPRVLSEDMGLFLRSRGVGRSAAESVIGRAQGDVVEAIGLSGDTLSGDHNRELFIKLMRVCYKKDVIPMLDWAEEIAASTRDKQKQFIEYALHMFRQSILRNYTEEQLTRVSEEENAFLKNFSRFISGNNVFDFMNTFNDAHYHLERNANPKILFTNMCFKVMRYIHFA